MIKVVTLLTLLAIGLARGEETEATTAATGEEVKPAEDNDATTKPEDKSPEKRGLFRVTGVHGENPSQYQLVYDAPQQQGYQPQATHVEPRAIPSTPLLLRPYPGMGYSAQPSYQQQPYMLPSPYTAPTTMILLMMPPHPGNPYGSLMLVPASGLFSPNHITPYNAPHRVPIQFVPQYVPVPVKGYQGPSYPAAHFKDYPQKPLVQTLSPQYQEQPSSAEDVSQEYSGAATSQNYGAASQNYGAASQNYGAATSQSYDTRTPSRPLEPYVKG